MAKKQATKGYQDTPETLLSAIIEMQNKILASCEQFESEPLTIDAEMGDGRVITRANPFIQEYRALVKDFSVALKNYKELDVEDSDEKVASLEKIRTKFKVSA